MNFSGKVALVTGAAKGIGRATALEFAELGANVAMLDVDYEGLGSVKADIEAMGRKALILECDISDESCVNGSVEKIISTLGKIDIVVNNAALFRAYAPFTETPVETWKRYFDVNVMGTVYVTRAVLGGMIDRGWGRVINVASVAGIYGLANMAQYSATKGAVISFTKAVAKELADKGVLVNAVSPGSVSPGDVEDVTYTQKSALTHMGRTGSDRENANLICFLASEEASYITGENICIDGSRKLI